MTTPTTTPRCNIKDVIVNVTYELVLSVYALFRASDSFFLRHSDKVEKWSEVGNLFRYCIPQDNLGEADISINQDLQSSNMTIIYRRPSIMLSESEGFFEDYRARVQAFLNRCKDPRFSNPAILQDLRVHKITMDLKYNGELERAMFFFGNHPNRSEICKNFESLIGFPEGYIISRNFDTFGFTITSTDGRDHCMLNCHRGKILILSNLRPTPNFILILQDFLRSVISLKRSLEFRNIETERPLQSTSSEPASREIRYHSD